MHHMSASKHLTLRNVPSAIMRALDREKRRNASSLNRTAIESLGKGLGVGTFEAMDNGLGELAGTWNEARLKAFEQATAVFERVDNELWK